jgi:hypothetical protein
MEANPNHPVTAKARENWHKLAALVLFKSGKERITITIEDIKALQASGKRNIVVHDTPEGLHLFLVDDAEGERLARKEGGLPV